MSILSSSLILKLFPIPVLACIHWSLGWENRTVGNILLFIFVLLLMYQL